MWRLRGAQCRSTAPISGESTYSTVGGIWEFGFRYDLTRPLQSLAEHMLLHNLCIRGLGQRSEQMRRYVDEWGADAVVIHSVKSCRLFSAGQGDIREFFSREMGVPTLLIESDVEDPRYFAEASMQNRVDAFFEALEQKKEAVSVQTLAGPSTCSTISW